MMQLAKYGRIMKCKEIRRMNGESEKNFLWVGLVGTSKRTSFFTHRHQEMCRRHDQLLLLSVVGGADGRSQRRM